MLPRADLNGVNTVNPVAPLTRAASVEAVGDARQQAFQRALGSLVGQSMQGEILSKLNDGSFLVKVAGTSARMQLPAGAQVGGQVPLTLLAASPRPLFEIQIGAGVAPLQVLAEAAPTHVAPSALTAADDAQLGADAAHAAQLARPTSYAAALLGRAPLTPASQLPPLDPNSAQATLSPTAMVLSRVLGAADDAGHAARAVLASAPVATSAQLAPEQLAGALKNAIGKSGLFYESHVADWAGGKLPINDLSAEPQMRAHAGVASGQAQPGGPTDAATAQFINLQLLTHEQGRVAWQGELWPGQPLQWEIGKDAPEREPGPHEEAEPGWRSGLRLRFPMLGDIAATLVMRGDQLHIQLQAGSGEVSALLRRHASGLNDALSAAGTPAASLSINATGAGAEIV